MGTQVTVQKALRLVASHPDPETDVVLDLRVHELVCRALFEIANSPDVKVRGSMSRATRAQRLIMNRMVGVRRKGTHPAARKTAALKFVDLTQAELPRQQGGT